MNKILGLQRGFLAELLLCEGDYPTLYHNQCVLTLPKPLDRTRLTWAWRSLLSDHPMLRAGIVSLSKKPQWLIPELPEVVIKQQTFQGVKAFKQWLEVERALPFDLSKPPLMRFFLVKLIDDDNRLFYHIWTHHHILLDGYSALSLGRQVMALYDGDLTTGKHLNSSPADDLYPRYADYFSSLNKQHAQDYWKTCLGDYDAPVLQIPRLPVPAAQRAQARVSAQYSSTDHQAMRLFARRHKVTPTVLMEAAWGFLLATYTNSTDVLFGSVRTLPPALFSRATDKQDLGLLINNLPVRARFDSETTVIEYLNHLRQQHQAFKAVGASTLTDIAHWVMPHQQCRLFNWSMSYIPQSPNALKAHWGPAWHDRALDFTVDTQDELLLEIFGEDKTLALRLNYDVQRVSAAMAEQMLADFKHILTQLCADEKQKLWSMHALSLATYQQVINDWNDTTVDYQQDATQPLSLQGLFEAQAAQHPDRLAIKDDVHEMRYGAFNRKINQFAHYLKSQGVKSGAIVAVHMTRCLDRVMVTWAILKAGGVYLPLDVQLPTIRLRAILEDARPLLVLSQLTVSEQQLSTVLLAMRKTTDAPRLINMAEMTLESLSLATDNPPVVVTPEDTSYLIYTSGSTGQPKGVLNKHRGTLNNILWMQQQFQLTSEDRLLHKTSISFDISAWEIFWPFTAGAALIIATPGIHRAPAQLVQWIIEYRVTVLHLVPTMLATLLAESVAIQCSTVRLLLVAGEIFPLALAKKTQSIWPHVHFLNLYGPAEASLHATFHHIATADLSMNSLPIGKPIANTQIYILDKRQQPLPIGVMGEIYIAGTPVAQGYLNRPKQTASAFLTNPFAADNDEQTYYRTGDFAYFLPGGEAVFVGRQDRQIKQHGQRIELAEVEAMLLAHPSIQQAAVITKKKNMQIHAI